MVSSKGSAGFSTVPSAAAMVFITRVWSDKGARSTQQTPREKVEATSAATRNASGSREIFHISDVSEDDWAIRVTIEDA